MLQKIRLDKMDDVREFVNAAEKCDFDVDLGYGRVMIDAKSVMGVLGMDLARALTVVCHGEDLEFQKTLQKWAVS